MSPEALSTLVISLWPWVIIKICLLILLFLYIIFSVIVWRQIGLMNQVVEAQISPVLQTIGLSHLIVAVGIFLFALIVL